MSRVRCIVVLAMVLVLAVPMIAAAADQPRGGGGQFGSFLGLMSVEKVRQELKVSDEQADKVRESSKKLWGEMSEQFGSLREIEDRQEQMEKYIELGDKLDEKARGVLGEILSGEQMIRLYQIRLQVRGPVYGLNHPWIANRLKLTEEQKKKAARLEKTTRQKTLKLFAGLRDLSRDERREKWTEIREKLGKIREAADKKALGLLTGEQKEAFEGLKGDKFEL